MNASELWQVKSKITTLLVTKPDYKMLHSLWQITRSIKDGSLSYEEQSSIKQ